MADAIKITTVATAIAAISISGVTVKDISAIPEAVNEQDCPLLAPRPDNYVSNLRVAEDTFGGPVAALKSCYYTLNYTFYYSPVAAGAGLFEKYDDMVTKAAAVLLALAATIIGGTVEHTVSGISVFGPVADVT